MKYTAKLKLKIKSTKGSSWVSFVFFALVIVDLLRLEHSSEIKEVAIGSVLIIVYAILFVSELVLLEIEKLNK